jgi:rare lipoprotein A
MKHFFCYCKLLFFTLVMLGLTELAFSQDSLAVKDSMKITDSTLREEPLTEIEQKKEGGKTLFGQASFYASKFEGRKTANGEIFRHQKFTAACNVLPLGTWIKVTNLKNNNSVIVKTNDRLHPKMNRIVDLTMAAAKKLDFVSSGLAKVKVVVLGKNYKNR